MIHFERVHEGRRVRFVAMIIIRRPLFIDFKIWCIPSYWKFRLWPRCWVLGPVSVEWGKLGG